MDVFVAGIYEATPEKWATYLSIAASFATIAALIYAVHQFRHTRHAASANVSAMLLTNISARFETVAENNKDNGPELFGSVCELLNELELACAVYFDGQMGGNTGKLSVALIKDVLSLIEKHSNLLQCVERAVQKPDTFCNIKRFAKKFKSDWRPLNPN